MTLHNMHNPKSKIENIDRIYNIDHIYYEVEIRSLYLSTGRYTPQLITMDLSGFSRHTATAQTRC